MRCVYRSVALLVVLVLAVACGNGGTGDGGNQGGGGLPEGTGLVRLAAARTGNYGLRVPISNPLALSRAVTLGPQFVQDDTPNGLQRYAAHFWVNLDGAQLNTGDRLELFNGYSQNGNAWFKAEVEHNAGESRLVTTARINGGAMALTSFGGGTQLPPGFNQVAVLFDSVNGALRTRVNGVLGPTMVGLANSNGQIDFVRLGIVDGNHDPSSSGFIDFDDFGQQSEGTLPNFVSGSPPFPPLTTLVFAPQDSIWTCLYPGCGAPGGTLSGDRVQGDGVMQFNITGTGGLSTFTRTMPLPYTVVVDIGPGPVSGGTLQTFPIEAVDITFGPIVGDPDFSSIAIRVGQSNGLPPTTGTTQLTKNPDGSFQVDSFFDIVYRIEFVGAPGSDLEGFSNSTGSSSIPNVPFIMDPLIFADGFESGDTSAW